jgi:predicted nucleotidyltransferase
MDNGRFNTETSTAEFFRAAWRARARRRNAMLGKRRDKARRSALHLASIIANRHGIDKVVLFGSTLVSVRFHEESDIDLAVWGLRPEEYFNLLCELENATDFPVDLVPAEDARPNLLTRIEKGEILYERKHD